jgi:small subunit ribosomal protein S16
MVRIRLARYGLKRQPVYRLVVMDKRKARNSREIELIGHHNPRTRPITDVVDDARALYWLSVGAQPSDAARRVLERAGTMALFERYRKGEDMETLVAEAEAAKAEAEPISPRTNYPAPKPGEGKGPRAQERAEAAAEADAQPEAAPEEEAEAAED